MAEAAEIGTRKVIAEHSTIGIVVTTDGSITDLPREAYGGRGRVISELKELGKPFLLLLNSARPESDEAQTLRAQLAETYDVTCLAVSCLDLSQRAVTEIIQSVLFEFPLEELQLFLPTGWTPCPRTTPSKPRFSRPSGRHMDGLHRIRDVRPVVEALGQCQPVTEAAVTAMRLGTGTCQAGWTCPGPLLRDHVPADGVPHPQRRGAAQPAGGAGQGPGRLQKGGRRHGGGPGHGVRHRHPRRRGAGAGGAGDHQAGGRYGCASGQGPQHPHDPGGHPGGGLPIVGSEKQSEDMLGFLLQEFEGEPERIWQSNIFGRSFHELINEDLASKLKHMPEEARQKMQQTLERSSTRGPGASSASSCKAGICLDFFPARPYNRI